MSEPEPEDNLHHHLLQNIKQSFTLADIEFSNHFPASVAQTNPPYLHYNNNNNNNNSQALAQAQQLLQIGGGGGGHSPPAGAAAGLLSQGQGGPAAANLENFHFPPPPPPPPAAAAAAGLFINIPYHHHHHSTAAVTNSFITDEHEHAPPLILLNNNNNKHRKRITNNCGQAQKGERVGRGKKVKGNIIINEEEEEKGRDDVVHVRAKRGQATDTHSLAERVRRRKINERLRCLQDIVPGCYKTMGMAVMLDEIINYVQSLQTQVEFLSMRLTAASTFYDLNSSDTDNIGMETMLQKAKTFDQALNYYHHQNISLAAANQEQEGLPFAELLYNMPHHYHTSN